MLHLQLHASCTKTLAEAAVESHFLGEHLSLLKLEILFSFRAAFFLNHYVLNNRSKKSGLGLLLPHRYIYFLRLRKKTLCYWKLYRTAFVHDSGSLIFLKSCPLIQNKKQTQECHHLESRWPLSESSPTSWHPQQGQLQLERLPWR